MLVASDKVFTRLATRKLYDKESVQNYLMYNKAVGRIRHKDVFGFHKKLLGVGGEVGWRPLVVKYLQS